MTQPKILDNMTSKKMGELPIVTQNLESNPKEYPNLGQRQK